MQLFTPKQKEILAEAKKNGFVTNTTFQAIFASPIARKANLEKFLALGILVQDGDKYNLNAEKLSED